MGDKERIESNKQLTDAEVKSHSRHGRSLDSSSFHFDVAGNKDDENQSPHDKSQKPDLKPATIPPRASTEQPAMNQTPATGQVPAVCDSNRIPTSIFGTKPATQMDWSISSNESLFSIHVGNSSFSKDQLFMLHKSGELAKYDEQIIAQSGLPPLSKLHNHKPARNENIEKGSCVAEEVHNPKSNTATMDVGGAADNKKQEKKMAADQSQSSVSNSVSCRSDESTRSTLSFAFPVLINEVTTTRSSSMYAAEKESKKQPVQQPVRQSVQRPEAQPNNPVTPHNSSCCSWFSFFFCCHCPCFM